MISGPSSPGSIRSMNTSPSERCRLFSATGLSIDQLAELVTNAQTEMAWRERQRRKDLRSELERRVTAEGYKMGDIFPELGSGAAGGRQRRKMPVRFRNPQNPDETWTGIGRSPKGVQAILEERGIDMYELIIASSLIRAGFELTLEDETDASHKHCEFAAVSKKTGKKYSVEAKMKSVAGILGKTRDDGASPDSRPESHVTRHLRQALRKPADGERLVFIDVNAPAPRDADSFISEAPNWINPAARRLERSERDLQDDVRAYVFVTNLRFHWHLEDESPPVAVLAHGLGIPDFGKPGYYRLSDTWRSKQRYIDGHRVMESLGRHPHVPSTFDGSLPLTDKESQNRIIIGETYLFALVSQELV